MLWFTVLPMALIVVIVLADAGVTLFVEYGERQRGSRNPARRRSAFRPVVIQGGKAQAPPAEADAARESKSA